MGLFSHHEKQPESAEFRDLVLDEEGLHTPVGLMPLAEIKRAEFLRDIVSDGYGPEQTSAPAVVGGAVAGGVMFGAAGAVAGGLLGSTVKEEGPERLKTQSVQLIFETDALSYREDIAREDEGGAITFADTVKSAMKHQKG